MTAEELWKEFCEQKKIDPNTPYEAWAFCGGGPAADELAELVLERKKFGTASAYDDYVYEGDIDAIPKIGDYRMKNTWYFSSTHYLCRPMKGRTA